MADARFEDGGEAPVFVTATDAEGLGLIAALTQDAVFPATDMRWDRAKRRFAVLLNRFRWEDKAQAERAGRPYERVRSLLVVEDVDRVATQGIDRRDGDTVLALLTLRFEEREPPAGRVELVLAGDGAVALEVECLEVTLRDVTRPYIAPSGKVPDHGV